MEVVDQWTEGEELLSRSPSEDVIEEADDEDGVGDRVDRIQCHFTIGQRTIFGDIHNELPALWHICGRTDFLPVDTNQ